MFSVKEIFYTLQGEGAQAGRAAVFCRFTGCNLWTGREEDRATATCNFCDTKFVGTDGPGGGKFATAVDLAAAIRSFWSPCDAARSRPLVVFTGGEPLLQLTTELVDAMHAIGFEVAIETNGTQPVPTGVDWVCVSPKAGTEIVARHGDELKLVYPQPDLLPQDVSHWRFDHYFLQPMDGPERASNTAECVAYCLAHPQWRISLQQHKLLGIR